MKECANVICGHCGIVVNSNKQCACRIKNSIDITSPCQTCYSPLYVVFGCILICSNPNCPEYYIQKESPDKVWIKYKEMIIITFYLSTMEVVYVPMYYSTLLNNLYLKLIQKGKFKEFLKLN